MNKIVLPKAFNYIGVFLTLRCNLNCPYCVNKQGEFKSCQEMTGKQWIEGLNRIETTEDLPITLQGGEPTIHKDFYEIATNLHGKHMDLLTNGKFNTTEFINHIHSGVFNRKKPPIVSIRMSYHNGLNDKYLTDKIGQLKGNGYNVGVFGINHKDNSTMKRECEDYSVSFVEKEYLDKTHGTYKYPEALDGVPKKAKCKPSELLINPAGYLFRCHSDLYANRNHYAHILDGEVTIPDDFAKCNKYGTCNVCDIKLKTNRLMEKNHCSVTIKS